MRNGEEVQLAFDAMVISVKKVRDGAEISVDDHEALSVKLTLTREELTDLVGALVGVVKSPTPSKAQGE